MFTTEQIKAAHSQVKSGADFPSYIRDIKKLGVKYYETLVANGNSDYYASGGDKVSTGARYDEITIAETSNPDRFKSDLKAHQEGKTDFPAFCRDCGSSGIEKWVIYLDKMTCIYYDRAGTEVLAEDIPEK